MSAELVLGLDQGTGSSRAVLVDRRGKVHASSSVPVSLHRTREGHVEQDAEELLASLRKAVALAFRSSRLRPERVAAIGLACQRSTSVLSAGSPPRPLAPAIGWQCERTRPLLERLPQRVRRDWEKRTGLPVLPHYAATKYRWLLDHHSSSLRRHRDWRVGTLDSFLLANLADDGLARTDLSQAHRSLLVDLGDQDLSARTLRRLGLDRERLPVVVPTLGDFGRLRAGVLAPLPAGVPIVASAGDQQAAAFGIGARRPGDAKATFGTGAFLLANAGTRVPNEAAGVLRAVGWSDARAVHYVAESNVPASGSALRWWEAVTSRPIADLLAEAGDQAWSERVRGVRCLPGFAGMGVLAPDWRDGGHLRGLRGDADATAIAIALCAGVGAALALGARAIEASLGALRRPLSVDGGGSRDARFLQIQADLLQRTLVPAADAECTAFGAAALAFAALGVQAPAVGRRTEVRPKLGRREARARVEELARWLHEGAVP